MIWLRRDQRCWNIFLCFFCVYRCWVLKIVQNLCWLFQNDICCSHWTKKKKETFDDNNCSFISNKSKNETKNRMKFMALANIFTHIDVIIKYIHSFRIGWILNYFWSSVVRMRKNATIKEYCYLLMNKIWSMTI